ncbi:hypothetical protein [Streptomyces sp. SID9913]|uniref:hypothetical protein n=1 Tax=Streptomyces sp. SID9913 TaxID=2706117 RepID=UPI0023B2E524|nr:hypothetical protein [Streptomyces sp. SID9913]
MTVPWRTSVALGGDCLADIAMLRAEPAVFGPVASDPTVSRLIDTLATAGPGGNAGTPSRRVSRPPCWEDNQDDQAGSCYSS